MKKETTTNPSTRQLNLLFLMVCTIVITLMTTGCKKNEMAKSAEKLANIKVETISEVIGTNNVLSIVTLCDDKLIGNLEQPHAHLFIAENAKFFKKVVEETQGIENTQIRIVYKSSTNGDEQVFEFTPDKLKQLTENPEKALQEAKEELEQLIDE